MGCCMCEEYRWPDPQEVVWKDEEGGRKEYCVFHAPVEHKGVSDDSFNDMIFARIDAVKAKNDASTLCHLDGVVFKTNISFEKYDYNNQLPSVIFDNSTFAGEANFTTTEFGGLAPFNNSFFSGNAFFTAATFIRENTDFTYDPLKRIKADFSSATFCEEAYFCRAEFNCKARFLGATFKRWANFDMATFTGETDFTAATFEEQAGFRGTEFGSKSIFRMAAFEGVTKFTGCRSSKPLVFRELQSIKDLRFFDMDMSASDFLLTPLTNIRFQKVTWKKSEDNARYCLPIEDHPAQAGMGRFDELFKDGARYDAVSDFYRQMKKRNRDEQNDAEASLWHYAEKEAQLKHLEHTKPWLNFSRRILATYRAISRYGEDPRQAGEVLFYLLVMLFGILSFGGFHHLGKPPFDITSERVSNLFLTFAQYALFIKPTWTPPPIYDVFVLLFSRLLIPIQAAIFAFALRNKLHR